MKKHPLLLIVSVTCLISLSYGQITPTPTLNASGPDLPVLIEDFSVPRNHRSFNPLEATQVSYLLDSIYVYNYIPPDMPYMVRLYIGKCTFDSQQRITEIFWVYVDSTHQPIHVNLSRYTYTYSPNGLLSTWYKYQELSPGTWEKTGGEEFTYDLNDSLVQLKRYDYHNYYMPIAIYDFTYNSIGQRIGEEVEYWVISGQTTTHYKARTDYSYDIYGRLLADTTYSWNNAWVGVWANTHAYNLQGLDSSFTQSMFPGTNNDWYETYKLVFLYDSLDRNISMKFLVKDSTYGPWVVSGESYYTYTTDGKLDQALSYYAYPGMPLLPHSREYYYYSPLGLKFKTFTQKYDLNKEIWVNSNMHISNQDMNGNTMERYCCKWDTTTLQWDSILIETAVHDLSLASQLVTNPVLQDVGMVTGIYIPMNTDSNAALQRSYFYSDFFTDSSYLERSYVYFYSDIAANTTDYSSEQSAILIYPNPASENVQILIPETSGGICTIKIYNTMGMLVYFEPIYTTGSFELDLSDLPNGLYIIQLLQDDQVIGSSKLIRN